MKKKTARRRRVACKAAAAKSVSSAVRDRGLSPKQRAFVTAYLANGKNAGKAAIAAGYSPQSAETNGPRLLRNDQIKAAVEAGLTAAAAKHEITLERWLKEYAAIAFSDLKNHITIEEDTGAIRALSFDEMPEGASRALESITEIRTIHESVKGERTVVNERVTFKLHPKIAALRDIGEYFGWLKKGLELSAPGVEKAIYELSEKFLPEIPEDGAKSRGHVPK